MIGIDPGYRKCHVFDLTTGEGMEWTTESTDVGVILQSMGQWLQANVDERHGPIWVEAPVVAGARNLQSTIKVAMGAGTIHSALGDTHQVPVSSWKSQVFGPGKGNADKSYVAEWLREHRPEIFQACGRSPDLRDAACIALYGQAIAARADWSLG